MRTTGAWFLYAGFLQELADLRNRLVGKIRGEYQKRRERYEKVKDIFAIIVILFVAFTLTKMIVDNVIILNNIRQNSLETYTGAYSCELKRTYGRRRHHYYFISLQNGDTLSIPRSSC